jgi:hypothetical protein
VAEITRDMLAAAVRSLGTVTITPAAEGRDARLGGIDYKGDPYGQLRYPDVIIDHIWEDLTVRGEDDPEPAAPGLVDRRCGHDWCARKGVYRMIGGCSNCGAEPLLGLFTATHEARGGDCPTCGCDRLHWDRLATPDEIPADFEQGAEAPGAA